MISFRSFKTFVSLNTLLISIGFVEHYFFSTNFEFFIFPYMVGRNFLLTYFIHLLTKEKSYITYYDYPTENHDRTPRETYMGEFDVKLIQSAVIETTTFVCIQNYFDFQHNFIMPDLMLFIPISFVFEIFFDFFHYWMHRFLHNRYLYPYFHKMHHKYSQPIPILSFYHHPVDLLITNSLPFVLAIYSMKQFGIIPSLFQYHLLSVYKTFVEISGHCGKETKSSSFPQCIWLPKIFNIELYVENHDRHHRSGNCNFSKRFSIFDRIFNTFQES